MNDYNKILSNKQNNIIILLDNVRSMHNIGSIFRSADAFQINKIFLCGISATPPHRKIQKTALGSTDSVNWEYNNDIVKLIKNLKKKYVIIGVEQIKNAKLLHSYVIQKKFFYVLIFGNELHGISKEILYLIDEFIEIPQSGIKKSLNISVAVGIILWEFYKILKQF